MTDRAPAGGPAVADEVFERRLDAGVVQPLDDGSGHACGQRGVLAERLLGPAPPGLDPEVGREVGVPAARHADGLWDGCPPATGVATETLLANERRNAVWRLLAEERLEVRDCPGHALRAKTALASDARDAADAVRDRPVGQRRGESPVLEQVADADGPELGDKVDLLAQGRPSEVG